MGYIIIVIIIAIIVIIISRAWGFGILGIGFRAYRVKGLTRSK